MRGAIPQMPQSSALVWLRDFERNRWRTAYRYSVDGTSSQTLFRTQGANRMKILVEPVVFRFGRCGMTRYYGAVLDGLTARGVEVVMPLLTSGCDTQTSLSRRLHGLRSITKAAPLLEKLSNFWFRRKVLTGDYDLVLLTDPAFGRKWSMASPDVRFVMVVHDLMSCIVAPDGLYDSAGPALVNLLYLTRRAAGVICISEDTRQALMRMAPLEEERVAVVRTGNLLAASEHAPARLELPERFLLFVGERSGRKGFYVLARTFAAIREHHPDVWIVCTGILSDAETDLLERFGIAKRVKAIQLLTLLWWPFISELFVWFIHRYTKDLACLQLKPCITVVRFSRAIVELYLRFAGMRRSSSTPINQRCFANGLSGFWMNPRSWRTIAGVAERGRQPSRSAR